MIYTMMEACRETGMTYQGLKFYCNEGLIPNVKRDKINRRVFDENDIAWIKSLRKLRKCGMSLADIHEYMSCAFRVKRAYHSAKSYSAGHVKDSAHRLMS